MRLGKWIYTIPLRLRSLFGREQVEKDLSDELRDHLDRKTQEYVAQGMTQEDAHRRARLDLGGIEQTKDKCRDARRVNWIQDFVQDLRYGTRTLRKSPEFTIVAVLTLALGIGANTAIFSVVNGVLLKPLPFPESNRLVEVMRGLKSGNDETVEASKYIFWQQHSRVFEAMAAFDIFGTGFNLASGGQPEHVTGMRWPRFYGGGRTSRRGQRRCNQQQSLESPIWRRSVDHRQNDLAERRELRGGGRHAGGF